MLRKPPCALTTFHTWSLADCKLCSQELSQVNSRQRSQMCVLAGALITGWFSQSNTSGPGVSQPHRYVTGGCQGCKVLLKC